jgi:UDP-3-O-[3-hydroxymyristoyl] N-acetylglucosamine deacetylase
LFIHQRTLKNAIHCTGVGVHSGARATLVLKPAEPNSGVVFRRTDLPGQPEIPALWTHAVETPLCTTLADGEVKISTIEHLMSALAGCAVDNVIVEIDGPELPIMDGSASAFVFLIECAGIADQAAGRRALRIRDEVEISESHRSAKLVPATQPEVRFEIDFDSKAVQRQVFDMVVTAEIFKEEVARARTFGFLHEVEAMRKAGLALGGSLDNAIVIDNDRVMNEGGLRFDDEFVRHKALDSIGDLYLTGAPVLGRFEGIKAGHTLTLRLVTKLMETEGAWEWVDLSTLARGGAALAAGRAVAKNV